MYYWRVSLIGQDTCMFQSGAVLANLGAEYKMVLNHLLTLEYVQGLIERQMCLNFLFQFIQHIVVLF